MRRHPGVYGEEVTAVDLAHVVDAAYVGVRDLTGDSNFTQESLQTQSSRWTLSGTNFIATD